MCAYATRPVQSGQRVSDRTNAAVARYAAVVREVGASVGVPVLDMYSQVASLPPDRRAAWAYDGLHPGGEGQAMIAAAVLAALQSSPSLSGVLPGSLPMHWPPFNAIDPRNPGAALDPLLGGSS
jgi:GDSL-like Lipase/Acylhydrolase family